MDDDLNFETSIIESHDSHCSTLGNQEAAEKAAPLIPLWSGDKNPTQPKELALIPLSPKPESPHPSPGHTWFF